MEADGSVWEPSEEWWQAADKLTGHEAEEDREACADVRGYATDPGDPMEEEIELRWMPPPMFMEGEDA